MKEDKAVHIRLDSKEQFIALNLLRVANGLTWKEMLLLGAEVLESKT
jgi:hypothetical protein